MDIKSTFNEGSEGLSDLQSFVGAITFLQNLLSPNRGYAKNVPRDNKGRIKVNLTFPHKLKNMKYFTKAGDTFVKTGKYTEAYPSRDPNSPYIKFWNEERRRCIHGYVRKSDGEWLTGYHYYYVNYSPIMKTVITGVRTKEGSVRAERNEGFPDMWDGDYLYFHYVEQAEAAGEYGAVLKARGKGYSFKAASMLIRNYQLFKKSKSFAFAGDTEYLDTDGVLNKAWTYMDFANKHVGFAKKLRLKDTMMEKSSGYNKPGDPVGYGFLSSVVGVTLKNAPGKARGKRGKLIIWEEAGIFPNILKSWRIAQKSMEDSNRIFGFMVAFGTGGEKGANFEGLEALFYKPKAYRVKYVTNVYDKNTTKQVSGFFVPDYLNRADCYDEDGNSMVIKGLEEIIAKRLRIKYAGVDSDDLAQSIAEEAITPQEAVMQTEGTIFPIQELKNYYADIAPRIDSFTATHYVGELYYVNAGEVSFKPDLAKVPLREYPVRKSNTEGSIEIFEMPKTSGGKVHSGRYIGGADTVDDEYGTSLFSILILDLITDNIVAEWTGRFRTADQNFEIALKLAIFYNAEINYENKLKGMFSYFDRKNKLRYLCDTPAILQDMDYVATRERYGNKKKGTPPTVVINGWGRKLQADWMITPNSYYEDELSYKFIRSLGYIREAIAWNINGNFDRISAGIMLFILREDRRKMVEANKGNQLDFEDDYNEDPFFTGVEAVQEEEEYTF